MLGDDGGAVREPERGAEPGVLFGCMANGAGGPGPADHRRGPVLQGQLLIIEVYCPEELEEFQQFVDDLETTDSANG